MQSPISVLQLSIESHPTHPQAINQLLTNKNDLLQVLCRFAACRLMIFHHSSLKGKEFPDERGSFTHRTGLTGMFDHHRMHKFCLITALFPGGWVWGFSQCPQCQPDDSWISKTVGPEAHFRAHSSSPHRPALTPTHHVTSALTN